MAKKTVESVVCDSCGQEAELIYPAPSKKVFKDYARRANFITTGKCGRVIKIHTE